VNEIEWKYPIKGVATVYPISINNPLVIECMVRNRLEKRMEISLSDVTSNSASNDKLTEVRSVTPTNEVPKIPDDSLSSDSGFIFDSNTYQQKFCFCWLIQFLNKGRNLGREFLHSIIFKNDSTHQNNDLLRNSIAIKLLRYHRDRKTGLVTLVFDIIFSPSKSFV
jgi:hypothetical protein